jgi:hypothetical protein
MPLRDNPFITPEFAKADGFNDANEMQWWFRNRYKTLIFEGYLIKWELS